MTMLEKEESGSRGIYKHIIHKALSEPKQCKSGISQFAVS